MPPVKTYPLTQRLSPRTNILPRPIAPQSLRKCFIDAGGAGSAKVLALPRASEANGCDRFVGGPEELVPAHVRGACHSPRLRAPIDEGLPKTTSVSTRRTGKGAENPVDEVLELKCTVQDVVRRLAADKGRVPLRDRTSAILVDGSRMAFLALELAGATRKFGRYCLGRSAWCTLRLRQPFPRRRGWGA